MAQRSVLSASPSFLWGPSEEQSFGNTHLCPVLEGADVGSCVIKVIQHRKGWAEIPSHISTTSFRQWKRITNSLNILNLWCQHLCGSSIDRILLQMKTKSYFSLFHLLTHSSYFSVSLLYQDEFWGIIFSSNIIWVSFTHSTDSYESCTKPETMWSPGNIEVIFEKETLSTLKYSVVDLCVSILKSVF